MTPYCYALLTASLIEHAVNEADTPLDRLDAVQWVINAGPFWLALAGCEYPRGVIKRTVRAIRDGETLRINPSELRGI